MTPQIGDIVKTTYSATFGWIGIIVAQSDGCWIVRFDDKPPGTVEKLLNRNITPVVGADPTKNEIGYVSSWFTTPDPGESFLYECKQALTDSPQ